MKISTNKYVTFPSLMTYDSETAEEIILFYSNTSGTILSSPIKHRIGLYLTNLNIKEFKTYNGTITLSN